MNHLRFNSLKGSLNVITGCGSGLGKATLEKFLRWGSGPVLGIDRHFERDYESELDLSHDQKSRLELRQHSTFDESVEESLAEFKNKYGSIDNVINCAGVALSFLLTSKAKTEAGVYDLQHANNLLDFNTVGTFNMIRLATKYMIDDHSVDRSKTKCIINAGCFSTTTPMLGQSFYAGSKASLDSLTLVVARELSAYNIRCNTINVGFFDTRVIRESGEKVVDYVNKVSLCPSRLGQPDEFAHLVKAIVENQMLNGTCVKIDAGTRIPATF